MSSQIQKVREASRQIVRELGLLSNESPFDLSLSYRHVLIELDLKGDLTQQELTELLILDKSTVSRIIKKLASYKLIDMRADEGDKRFKLISLTAAGKTVVGGLHQSAITNVGRALQTLTSREREHVEAGLSLYATALKNARRGNANESL